MESRSFFLSGLFILWAGLILGVSFIATPVKFWAPHLTLPVALEIGQLTFHTLNKVEWGVCLVVILLTLNSSLGAYKWLFIGSLLCILLLQTLWFMPVLDARVSQIISGDSVRPGIIHVLYIGADILKIIIALRGAWWAMRQVQP